MTVLDEAVRSHPSSWWWLKADGCDINEGLKESVRTKWSGDVDLNDGSIEKQYNAYQTRLKEIGRIELVDVNGINDQLAALLENLTKDLEFVYSGEYLHKMMQDYSYFFQLWPKQTMPTQKS